MTAELRPAFAGLSPARYALAAAAVFGIGWAVIEDGLATSLHTPLHPVEVIWWRYGAHLALMLAVLVAVNGPRDFGTLVRTRRPVLQLVRATMAVIMPGGYVLALRAGASTDFVWSALWLSPSLIVAVSWMMGERPATTFALLAAAGAAVVMVIHGDAAVPRSPIATIYAGAMALSFVAYTAMTRMLRDETLSANLFYTALGPFIVLTLALPKVWIRPDATDALILSCIGAVGLVALYGLDRACHSAPAWVGAPGLLAQPLLTIAFSAVLAVHAPDVRACVGFALLCIILATGWSLADRTCRTSAVTAP